MRNTVVISIFSICIITLFIAAMPAKKEGKYVERAIGQINTQFQADLLTFNQKAKSFKAITASIPSQIEYDKVQLQYRALRNAYKGVEYIIEYIDKELTDKNLNGAPLPKLEKKVADIRILQPKGLQVIDELMVTDITKVDKEQLHKMASKLTKDVSQAVSYFKHRKITDRQFFEASRLAVIRIITLGITGFDTPGTTQGITDTQQVLMVLQNGIKNYKPELKSVGQTKLYKEIDRLFSEGIRQTTKTAFDSFNRMGFIKQIANPLYKTIKDIHLALDYETIYEVAKYLPAVNYDADNVFSKDFLDPYYYVSLENNETTKKKAALGKLLFYDPILSSDNKMACVSCHSPEKAFTDGLALSKSNTGEPLKRNSITLNYTVYATGFFYDLRTKRLEDQFEHVVVSSDEFNSSYKQIVTKLSKNPAYVEKFKAAFPNQKEAIRFNNIDYALAAYVMQLNRFDNPVDQYFQNKRER